MHRAGQAPPPIAPEKTKKTGSKLWLIAAALVIFVLGLPFAERLSKNIVATEKQEARTIQFDYPLCADAKDLQISEKETVAEVQMRPECFNGFIQIPLGWPKWWAQFKDGEGGQVWFQGAPRPTVLAPGKGSDPQTGKEYFFPGQRAFRAMGKGTLIVMKGEEEISADVR